MKKLSVSAYLLLLFCITHPAVFAQPYMSPAGVSSGLFAWYDGKSFDNTTQKWNPRFGSTSLERFALATSPGLFAKEDHTAGYNKTVSMDRAGVRAKLLPDDVNASYTVFAVSRRYGYSYSGLPYKPVTWGFGGQSAYPGFLEGNGDEKNQFLNSVNRREDFNSVQALEYGWTISSLNFAYGYDQRNEPKVAALNGEFTQIDAGGILPFSNGWVYLGCNAAFPPGSGGGEHHDFAEFIVYNRKLSVEERHRVHTYLSLKYSIPLLIDPIIGSRVTLDGMTDLWDTTKGYNHHVIGIGRSSTASLDARLSYNGSYGPDPVLSTIAEEKSPVSSNESFLLIGDKGTYHDYANNDNTMAIPGGTRLKRVWRVQNHGVSDSIRLAIASGAVPGGAQSFDPCAPARLLISTDSTFSTYTAVKLIPAILYGTTTPPLFSSFQVKTKLPQGESYFTYAAINSPGTPAATEETTATTRYDACADNEGFHYFVDQQDRPVFAIKGLSAADLKLFKLKIAIRMLDHTPAVSNGSTRSAMMKRLLSVNTSGFALNTQPTIRYYYKPEELTETETAGGTGFWFKKEATADQTITDFSSDGILEPGTFTILTETKGTQNGTAYIEFSNLQSFSTFGYISSSSALPVKLIGFNAVPKKQSTHLTWQTSSELNASHFDIQRRTNSQNWQSIAEIKAAGTTTETIKYSYTDSNTSGSLTYYRLKMVDLDGSLNYSRIMSVSTEALNEISLFPNPASGNTIRLKFDSAPYTDPDHINFLDAQGTSVLKISKNLSTDLDISQLQPGHYTVVITMKNGEAMTRKLVLVR
ncbi:hypothetical protein DSL64_06360 [Dyadobacter luteus]|uniref:Uncharacterized protein n=1 Tax=Dyadobacter luteus TaxID=2259619 RepID=A0A3D8YF97_9BACT|nr:T9SS type A sorting domain-containing protein [Dyadobacter luteus]REA63234.1 hypothetical protein DSL64_06360 [Dyadobacter luteus]